MQDKKTILNIIKLPKWAKFICLFVLLVILAVPVTTFTRYVIENIYDKYLISREFYFYSNALNGSNYVFRDWDGNETYSFTVDLKNHADELRWTKEDIFYDITVTCTSNIGDVSCDGADGSILYNAGGGTTNLVNINLSNPNSLHFTSNDYVDMTVTAKSVSGYEKTLSATFKIYGNPKAIRYSISDASDQKYFDLYISNDSSTTKNVNLAWNREGTIEAIVDNTNEYVISSTNNNANSVATINGIDYINGIVFSLNSRTSITIRFYKTDVSRNYTYPITNLNSLITVS